MIVPGPDGKGGVGDDDGGCTNDGTFNGFSVGGDDLGNEVGFPVALIDGVAVMYVELAT